MWAFLSLLRTDAVPLAGLMRRLLTGYAIVFNSVPSLSIAWRLLKITRISAIALPLRQKDYMKDDERILGDSDYVEEVLSAANESLQRRYQLKAQGLDVDKVAERVAALLKLPLETVWVVGKHREAIAARSLLCYWSVRQLGLNMSALAQRLRISPSSVSQSVVRGEALAKKGNYRFL